MRAIGVLSIACISVFSLVGCFAPVKRTLPTIASAQSGATDENTRDASGGFRDVQLCFHNALPTPVTLWWVPTMSSVSGVGPVASGETACAEGAAAQAIVTFADGFQTWVTAENPVANYPSVEFWKVGCVTKKWLCKGGVIYAGNKYVVNETFRSAVKDHHFSVTRLADNDWINFTIAIEK